MTPPFYLVGEGGTKVPTVRLDHASPQAVCRDTRLAQLSPACSPGSVALMSPWREREAQPIGSMATLPGSSGHPLCGRTALRSLLLSAHGHQGGASYAGPATPRFKSCLFQRFLELLMENIF
jgi:hypothetical protein